MSELKPSWADSHYCSHGISFSRQCDYCEIIGLQDDIKRMTRSLLRKEQRLAELLEKTNPLKEVDGG